MSVDQQIGFMRADLTGLAHIYVLPSYKGRKLNSVVRYDTAWDPKSINDGFEEGDSGTLGDADHRGGLWPLGELVDGDEEVPVPTDGPRKWSQNIHPHTANGQEGGIICRA
jgi:hypothetical protein